MQEALRNSKYEKGSSEEVLTKLDMKAYRNYILKLNWVANNIRSDQAVYLMESTRKQKRATLNDLRNK